MPKATPTPTTGALVAPSRRQLVGGSILAALSGAAFAGAVVLPNPGEASPAESLDAELIALCVQIEDLQRRYVAEYDAAEDDQDETDRLSLTVDLERTPLVKRATAMRAHTAAGHVARARMFLACDDGFMAWNGDDWNTALAAAVIRDLVAGGAA